MKYSRKKGLKFVQALCNNKLLYVTLLTIAITITITITLCLKINIRVINNYYNNVNFNNITNVKYNIENKGKLIAKEY